MKAPSALDKHKEIYGQRSGSVSGHNVTAGFSDDGQNPTIPMVTKKQIMSHHFGFGNIDVGNLETIRNKHTTVSPSLKFKEKLQLKQRQLEEQMMNNRLKKLNMEEQRLRQQIMQAHHHSNLAD